jgi:hypothetical protein
MQLAMDSNLREAFELLLALALGAMVGPERRLRGHPAGRVPISAASIRPLLACMVAGVTLLINIALHYVEHLTVKITAENP